MFRPIKSIAIIFLLSSCYSAKYTYQIQNDQGRIVQQKLIDNNEAIVVFGDDLYVDFVNISEPESSVLLTKYGNTNNINAVKIRPGRYFLPYGLFYNSRLTPCLSQPFHNISAIFLGTITFGLVIPIPSMGCVVEPKMSRFSDQTSVLYFDVKPGDIVYIGDISYSYWFSYLYNEDNFEDNQNKLKKIMPNIANNTIKVLMKTAQKPRECNVLTEDVSNDIKNGIVKNIKFYSSYKACTKALENLL
jgi:hypothetical protein